jgi:hypothetical protein
MVRSQILKSFVARIWLERTDDAEPEWRGHIRHIQGREETYFHDLEEMSEFMQQISGISGTPPSADPDKVVTIKKREQKYDDKSDQLKGND